MAVKFNNNIAEMYQKNKKNTITTKTKIKRFIEISKEIYAESSLKPVFVLYTDVRSSSQKINFLLK